MQASDVFRLDNDVLAFRFTATVSDRGTAMPRERLTDPERLRLWLDAAALPVPRLSGSALERAKRLREAIQRLGTATAAHLPLAADDLAVLNDAASAGRAVPELGTEGAHWRLSGSDPLRDALGVLAADAIRALGGAESRVRICEGVGCAGLFVDTSRGGTRRWCSMNTCGNRAKKARSAAR